MKGRNLMGLLLVPIWLGACADNPVSPVDDDHQELVATLELSGDDLQTLSEIEFEVTLEDDHGEHVTDVELVQVQFLWEDGDGSWRSFDLELHEDHFSGSYVFGSSGEYEFRVAVQRHGATEPAVVYEAPDHFEMARAHLEMGHLRVEFESFPGHVEEGEEAAMRFWISEDGQPVTGLQFNVDCEEEGGMRENHMATEIEDGTYETHHTFTSGGEFHLEFGFMDHHQEMVEGDFHFHVADGH